jgi:hypothetical protein
MKLDSNKKTIADSAAHISAFVAEPDNFGKLLPPQIKDWKSEGEKCSFTIVGVTDMHLFMSEHQTAKKVSYSSLPHNKIPLRIDLMLNSVSEKETEAYIALDAQLNNMIAMMAKRPLTNFINLLIEDLQKIFQEKIR